MWTFFKRQSAQQLLAFLFTAIFMSVCIVVFVLNDPFNFGDDASSLHAPLETLSTDEWLWITENPEKLIVASRDNFPPFAYTNHLGQGTGLLYDYLSLIEKKLGCQFFYVQYESLEELQDLIDTDQVAIVLDLQKRHGLQGLLETKVLFTTPRMLYINTAKQYDIPVYTLGNLNTLRMAVDGNSSSIGFLEDYYENISLKISASPLEMLSHLSTGAVDLAYINQKTADYYLRELNFPNLANKGTAGPAMQLLFNIRKDLPLLHNLIIRILDSLTPEQHERLIEKRLLAQGITMRLASQIGIIFVIICAIFLVAVAFFSLWTRSLQRQVAIKNAQLNEEMVLRCTMERQLLQSTKVEAIGTLASGVHHELSNILAVVSSYAEINAYSNDSIILRQNSIKIQAVAKQAHAVLNKLQAHFRREKEQRSYLPIHQSIEKSFIFLQGLLPKHVHIINNCKVREDAIPDIDDTLLMQIIINLCSNASDAMDGRGSINITCSELLHFSSESKGNGKNEGEGFWALPNVTLPSIVVSIQDTGHGIADSILPYIFGTFFTTKTPERGTGMGLAIVQDILKRVHAGFHVISSPKGTTFTVYLPLKVQNTPSLQAQSKRQNTGQNIEVYVPQQPTFSTTSTKPMRTEPHAMKSIGLISSDIDWLEKVQHIYQLCGCQTFPLKDITPSLLDTIKLVLVQYDVDAKKNMEYVAQVHHMDSTLPIVFFLPDETIVIPKPMQEAPFISITGKVTARFLAQILQYCR